MLLRKILLLRWQVKVKILSLSFPRDVLLNDVVEFSKVLGRCYSVRVRIVYLKDRTFITAFSGM